MRGKPNLPFVLSLMLIPSGQLMARQDGRGSAGMDLPADPDIGIYYKAPSGWEEMLPEVVNWKTGGVFKHVASVGIVQGDINGHVNLGRSRNVLSPPTAIVVYPPVGSAITEYQLLRLHQHSDSREFRTFTGGVVHRKGGADRDELQFEVKRLGKGVYQVFLPNLGDGEYGFLAPGGIVSRDVASLGKIYTFRIAIPKGTVLTTDAQLQNGSGEHPAVKPMTNGDVVALKNFGFSDDLVISKIKMSPANYRLDTGDILALKKSNISDAVIEAMLGATSQ